jgi:hypothetical protein
VILPTKGVGPDKALLSLGAGILRELEQPKTVSRLWSELSTRGASGSKYTFDWFVLALDLLYVLGAVEYTAGRVRRISAEVAQ